MQVPVWMLVLILGVLFYFAFDHGRQMYLNWRKKREENIQTRYILIGEEGSVRMGEVLQTIIDTHEQAGWIMEDIVSDFGYTKMYFENGDEIWACLYGKGDIPILSEKELKNFEQWVLVDSGLPENVIQSSIEKLGLLGYVIKFGIIAEEGGNK